MSRSLNKEIISTSCITVIILLFQLICTSNCIAASAINTNRKIIVIDPGHGGKDTGITMSSNLYEKDCTLILAKFTARILKNKYTVLLTRESDLFLPPFKRTSFANRKKADIFISLHAKKKETTSNSLIIYEPPSGVKPLEPNSSTSWEKEQLKHIKKSKACANIFSVKFSQKFKTDFNIAGAPAIVLQGAQMPAVLIEVLPMERLLGEADKKTILHNYAQAIAESLEEILR